MTAPWEAATFEGLEQVRARALAGVTRAQRLRWLADVLRLAAACGALALDRAERQRRVDEQWRNAGPDSSGGTALPRC